MCLVCHLIVTFVCLIEPTNFALLLIHTVHEECHEANLDNEEMHGEFLVACESDEKVGRKHASAIVICRPGTSPGEVNSFKASVSGDTILIVGPATSKSFLANSAQWLAKLKKNEKMFKATKLVSTLQALTTKLKKKKEKTKTTHISFKDLGLELSTKCFNEGQPDGQLMMIPLPHSCETTVGKKKNDASEVVCVWRAHIAGSEHEVEEEQTTNTDNGNNQCERMLKLMEDSAL